MTKIEELMENEEFIAKVEACETEDAVKAVYTEYGIEIADENSVEISEEDLMEVTGGAAITLAALAAAVTMGWKVGTSAGILIRSYYDMKKYGNPYRSYSKSKVDGILKKLNLI